MMVKGRLVSRGERGVVMIVVVLLLLVLTVLGMSAAIMMTQEDRSSSRAELAKEALYVAEAGLRRGEVVLSNVAYTNPTLTAMITHLPSGSCQAVTPAVPQPPVGFSSWDLAHLGTFMQANGTSGSELVNVDMTQAFGLPGNRRALYSLYVRNNDSDTGGAAINNDTKIRIVSVGWIANDRHVPLAVKILEEEFDFGGLGDTVSVQKQSDQGGTGSGLFGG